MKSCPDCRATYPDDYAICPKDGSPLHDVTLWQIGTIIRGKYRILARLGEGGMATVYKAHHELLDEFRALKVIKADLAHDPEFMGRFKNEAIMARRLTHPNAVRVDDLDIAEDGLPFIAMELVVGDTLKALIQRSGALPVSLVLDITLHICEALDAAHKLGLVHRDIKPENIVLIAQENGPPVAKILDFGISRLREETAGVKGLTQTGMVIGTPEYMSPEQARGQRGNEIDGRSDLYSLGVVMYRMLTGDLPFQADTTVDMLLHHLKTIPRPPHQLRPELAIPEAVSSIVMRALEKEPKRRFSSGAEMCAAIKKARGSTTLTSRKVDWGAVSSAAAAVGAQGQPAGIAADRVLPIAAHPTPPPGTTTAVTPAAGRPVHRASARIGPPPKEFPTRLVLTVVAAVVLAGGGFAGWQYYQSWSATPKPAPAALAAGSAKTEAPKQTAQKTAEASKTAETVTTPLPPPPHRGKPRTNLSFPEKAQINELNGLADEYRKQSGCEKAMSEYEKVLAIDPGDNRAYKGIMSCYSKTKRESSHPIATTP
jgi:serine/threonine-protein kinase